MADLAAGDRSAKKAAVNFLMKNRDTSLLPKLEEIRLEVDRRTRRLLKPLIDLLSNQVKLLSPDSETRRGAARDLGMRGYQAGLPLLEGALQRESARWVRYDIEEAISLINLENEDPKVRIAAITKLGEMRSANALPLLTEFAKVDGADPQKEAIA
ncbi:MAG: HEAT repeat domain-containing protein, partial [Candidatus Binatia bacterium]